MVEGSNHFGIAARWCSKQHKGLNQDPWGWNQVVRLCLCWALRMHPIFADFTFFSILPIKLSLLLRVIIHVDCKHQYIMITLSWGHNIIKLHRCWLTSIDHVLVECQHYFLNLLAWVECFEHRLMLHNWEGPNLMLIVNDIEIFFQEIYSLAYNMLNYLNSCMTSWQHERINCPFHNSLYLVVAAMKRFSHINKGSTRLSMVSLIH